VKEDEKQSLNPFFKFFRNSCSSGNALLVEGLTLTLWMPGQTLFASTSLYRKRSKFAPL